MDRRNIFVVHEAVVLHIKVYSFRFALAGNHPVTDVLCQLIQCQPDRIVVFQIPGACCAVSDRLWGRTVIHRCNSRTVCAIGESLNHEAVLSKFPGNDIGGGIRQLPNGCNGDVIQLFCCSRTYIEQIRYRKIPALLFEV